MITGTNIPMITAMATDTGIIITMTTIMGTITTAVTSISAKAPPAPKCPV
jgi:hypothetical protein